MWLWLAACSIVDRGRPQILVQGPDAPVRDLATFRISAQDGRPGIARLWITIDERRSELLPVAENGPVPVIDDMVWNLGVESLDEGLHNITFTVADGSHLTNHFSLTVPITVDRAPPVLELAEQSRRVKQGSTLALWIRADEPLVRGHVRFMDREQPLYFVDGALRALVGIGIREAPRDAEMEVFAEDAAGNLAVLTAGVAIEPGDFEDEGRVKFRGGRGPQVDAEARQRMRKERDEAFATNSGTQRWRGPMGLPVAYGRLGRPFGGYLRYRDGSRDYHDGMDLEKRQGARISAAGAGKVLLSTEQAVFGKVVMLDHGNGVITTYNHLESIEVAEGSDLTKGQVLGTMGATGNAERTHLHWGVVVSGVAVGPNEWLESDFSTSPF